MTTLIIARHGNTFTPDETPTRVGMRTDLPLVGKGWLQARAMGKHLKENDLIPDVVYSSALKRTRETADIALKEIGVHLPIYALDIFNEIDYGPDENKPEADVIARIGQDFAPHITDDFDGFSKTFDIKLKTGSLGIMRFSGNQWRVQDWNIVPILE